MLRLPDRVTVCEVGTRDGFQIEPEFIATEQKIEVVERLTEAGLLADHEALTRSLRADVDTVTDKYRDTGTADFLTGLLEQHEKMAWMLRSFLE